MIDSTTIAQARAVQIEDEIARRGIKLRGKVERVGPCPICGGRDRFGINIRKQSWNCRGCSKGGSIIDLVRHLDGVGFPQAVAILTGDDLPAKPTRPQAPQRNRQKITRTTSAGRLRRRNGCGCSAARSPARQQRPTCGWRAATKARFPRRWVSCRRVSPSITRQ